MDGFAKTFNDRLWEARRLQWESKLAEAHQVLARAAGYYTGNSSVAETMVRVFELELEKHHREALALLEQSQALLEPVLPGMFWYTRGVLLGVLAKCDQALASYEHALAYADQLDMRALWYGKSVVFREQRLFAEAIECLTQAQNAPGFMSEGEIYYALGEIHHRSYSLIRATQPDLLMRMTRGGGRYVIDLGRIYQLTEPAEQAYRQALAAPGFTRQKAAWYDLGRLYIARQENLQAIDCFSHVCPDDLLASLQLLQEDKHPLQFPSPIPMPADRLERVTVDACYQLATVYAQESQWRKSIALYTMLAHDTHRLFCAKVLPELFDLCVRQGFDKLLLRQYHNPAQCGQFTSVEWQLVGMILARDEHYDEALVCYGFALSDTRWRLPGMTRHFQGDVYAELGDFSQAIASYQYALIDRRYRVQHAMVWNNLGLAYQEIGKQREAQRCFSHVGSLATTP